MNQTNETDQKNETNEINEMNETPHGEAYFLTKGFLMDDLFTSYKGRAVAPEDGTRVADIPYYKKNIW